MPISNHPMIHALQSIAPSTDAELEASTNARQGMRPTARPNHMTPQMLMELLGVNARSPLEGFDEEISGLDYDFEVGTNNLPGLKAPPTDEEILEALANGLGEGV